MRFQGADVSVYFTVTDADDTSNIDVECALNGSTWMPCTSPCTAFLAHGAYDLQIAATDLAGNAAETRHVAFTIKSKKHP